MTRKDFKLIAAGLKFCKPTDDLKYEQWFATVSHFTLVLEETNPLFNHKRFLEACGV